MSAGGPGAPDLHRIERRRCVFSDAVDLDVQIPAEYRREDMARHGIVAMHAGGEGRDEDFAPPIGVVTGENMNRIMGHRESGVQPLRLSWKGVAVLLKMFPEGMAEGRWVQLAKIFESPAQGEIAIGPW